MKLLLVVGWIQKIPLFFLICNFILNLFMPLLYPSYNAYTLSWGLQWKEWTDILPDESLTSLKKCLVDHISCLWNFKDISDLLVEFQKFQWGKGWVLGEKWINKFICIYHLSHTVTLLTKKNPMKISCIAPKKKRVFLKAEEQPSRC